MRTPGPSIRSSYPAGSHWQRRFPGVSLPVPAHYPTDPTGKNTETWKQYSSRNFNVDGNAKTRKVPFIGLSPKIAWIRAGNQPEINISPRNPNGKVRPAAGCRLKNIGFRVIPRKIMQYFSGQRRTNKKRALSISMTLSLLLGIFETITSQLFDKDLSHSIPVLLCIFETVTSQLIDTDL